MKSPRMYQRCTSDVGDLAVKDAADERLRKAKLPYRYVQYGMESNHLCSVQSIGRLAGLFLVVNQWRANVFASKHLIKKAACGTVRI